MNTLLNRLKKEYFDWRTWKFINQNMKEQTKKGLQITRDSHLNKPGIAFAFDDSFRVNHWYTFGKELFGFYDVNVTFNINAFHHYEDKREHTQSEIDMMLELQAMGHEIAHHGFKHKNAVEYSRKVGVNKWIEDEIEPL